MGEAQRDNGSSEGVLVASVYYSCPKVGDQLHQGQLLRQVCEWMAKYDDSGKPSGAIAHGHKLAVIVAQECDLAQDFRRRKDEPMVETDLRSVLLCPARPAEEARDERREELNTSFWRIVRSNSAERYHYLAQVPAEADAAAQGHEPMLVDFRSYFAVRTVELYRQICATEENSAALFTILNVPWREHLQQRFASYQARVGLTLDHFIPEGRRKELPAPQP